MKWGLGLCAAMVISAGMAAADCAPGAAVADFSHVTGPESHPKGRSAARLAERVNAELGDRLCLRVHPNARLMGDNAVLEAVQRGEVQLAVPALGRLTAIAPGYQIFELPFLFRDAQAVSAFQEMPEGASLRAELAETGLRELALWHEGMKQMSANVPLLAPEDARGLRLRVLRSAAIAAQLDALGSVPTRIALPEVYPALQEGLVDGQENTWPQIFSGRFHEVQDGVTETNHALVTDVVIASAAWLDSLDPETRAGFLTILAEVTQAHNAQALAHGAAARDAIVAAGGTVRTLAPEARAAWVAAMRPVWAGFAADVGQDRIDAASRAAAPQVPEPQIPEPQAAPEPPVTDQAEAAQPAPEEPTAPEPVSADPAQPETVPEDTAPEQTDAEPTSPTEAAQQAADQGTPSRPQAEGAPAPDAAQETTADP